MVLQLDILKLQHFSLVDVTLVLLLDSSELV